MDVISIIFIVILLLFIILCTVKGFIRSIIFFGKDIISFLAAITLCRPLADLLMNLPTAKSSEQGMMAWLQKQGPLFSETIYPGNTDPIVEALKSLSIPEFVAKAITNQIASTIPQGGINLSETIATALVYIILCVISFILIIIVVRILFFILNKFIKGIFKTLPEIKTIDRLFGAILGTIIAIIIIDGVCFVFMGIISLPGLESIATYLQTTMKLEESTFTLSKFFYEHNILLYIFS